MIDTNGFGRSSILVLEERIKLNRKLLAVVNFLHNFFVFSFLIFLWLKLESKIDWGWNLVFTPLYLTSCLGLLINIQKFRRASEILQRYPSQKQLLWPIRSNIVDCLGTLGTEIFLCIWLENYTSLPLTIVLIPLWIGVTIGSIFRCMGGIGKLSRNVDGSSQGLTSSISFFIYRGVGPFLICLKLDNYLSTSWIIIFLPWWIPLLGLSIVTLCFCFTMPCLITCFNPFNRSNLRLPIEELCRVEYQRGWAIHLGTNTITSLLISINSFTFLIFLLQKLDYNDPTSYFQILCPLFVMYACSMLIDPLFVLERKKWLRIRRYFQMLQIRHNQVGIQQTEIQIEPRTIVTQSTSEMLLQQSSNVFESVLVSTFPQIDFEDRWMDIGEIPSTENSQCYICMGNAQNGVLMNCGHGGICFDCGTHLLQGPNPKCPLCRMDVERVLQLDKVQTASIGSEDKVVVRCTSFAVIQSI